MKVISKFKDYYDFVGKIYGEDDALTLNRNQQSFLFPLYKETDQAITKILEDIFTIHKAIHSHMQFDGVNGFSNLKTILVAENIFINLNMYDKPTHYEDAKYIGNKTFSIHEIATNVTQNINKISKSYYTKKIYIPDIFINPDKKILLSNKVLLLAKLFNSPLMMIHHDREKKSAHKWYQSQYNLMLRINYDINLRDYNIDKLLDAYQVFQSLQMMISNVNETPPIITFNDKIKIEKHGFDKKISFRHRK